MYTYSFEKLEVWKDAKDLVKSIYMLTKDFPIDEKFGLTAQIRRAAVSIPPNIAEGAGRATNKDKAHFTTIAFSSAAELLNQLIITYELGYLSENDYQFLRNEIEKITNKLNALRNSQIS